MTANQDAAAAVLARMGTPDDDTEDALAATQDVINVFYTNGEALTAEWECAAEFVATFAIVTGLGGSALRQVTNLARAAYKLQRF